MPVPIVTLNQEGVKLRTIRRQPREYSYWLGFEVDAQAGWVLVACDGPWSCPHDAAHGAEDPPGSMISFISCELDELLCLAVSRPVRW